MSFVTCEFDELLVEKIIHIWTVIYSEVVIPKKFPHTFQIKFPTKCIFQIFDIWKINKMTMFCNLFIERPSYMERHTEYCSPLEPGHTN